eukprot:scaffold3660_cov22-Cyclotella_meneghiniana.AAC.3
MASGKYSKLMVKQSDGCMGSKVMRQKMAAMFLYLEGNCYVTISSVVVHLENILAATHYFAALSQQLQIANLLLPTMASKEDNSKDAVSLDEKRSTNCLIIDDVTDNDTNNSIIYLSLAKMKELSLFHGDTVLVSGEK